VARIRVRSQRDVVDRCRALQEDVRAALRRLEGGDAEPGVVDAVWRAEALGTLLWALQLQPLPAYDKPFRATDMAAADLKEADLRPGEELEAERDAARLWHWRARTSELAAAAPLELPPEYATVDQVVAATAMRGYEQGALPSPVRGDFPAFGKVYRQLTPAEHAEAHSIALERHRALNWLCGLGETWDDVPLDT
jgi:hypothetical protein